MTAARAFANPEGYKPDRLPALLKKWEDRMMERIIDTVTIEGVNFQIIEKPKTIYAGFHIVAPDSEAEPDVMNTYNRFQEGHQNIADSVHPESMVCFSIGYREWVQDHSIIREFMHAKETTSPDQPEGIKVFEAPACLLIKVQSTDESWALVKKVSGLDNPQWHMAPLFHLAETLFCTPERGFAAGSEGNHEMEYYNFDGTQYVAIPVRRVG